MQVYSSLFGYSLTSKREQVSDNSPRPLCLVVNHPQVLAGELWVRGALEQELG
jgi:hypothetical protein